MPANLTKPFSESCCDGGGSSANANSARSCGCDPGANWTCQVHQKEGPPMEERPMSIEDTIAHFFPKWNNPLEKHLSEVVNKTWNAANKCETFKDHASNAAMGLSGEAGEVLDIHKKMFYHQDKDYLPELILELGDVCYYLAKTLELHGLTLEEILAANKAKLFERYNVHA